MKHILHWFLNRSRLLFQWYCHDSAITFHWGVIPPPSRGIVGKNRSSQSKTTVRRKGFPLILHCYFSYYYRSVDGLAPRTRLAKSLYNLKYFRPVLPDLAICSHLRYFWAVGDQIFSFGDFAFWLLFRLNQKPV